VDGERISSTPKKKKSTDELVKDQGNVGWGFFVPRGQMVNKQLYQEVLVRLRDTVRRKWPELWETQIWMLHHDNAPGHASLLIRSYLAKHQTVPHPPYSPADFFSCFPNLKPFRKDVVSKPQRRFREMR
jgi:hypothetical protein